MKKLILCVASALALVFVLASCNSNKAGTEASAGSEPTTSVSTENTNAVTSDEPKITESSEAQQTEETTESNGTTATATPTAKANSTDKASTPTPTPKNNASATATASAKASSTATPTATYPPTKSPIVLLKWEEFYALSATEQDDYLESFGNPQAFYEWMVDAQNQFKVDHPDIEIGADGKIDLSKLK